MSIRSHVYILSPLGSRKQLKSLICPQLLMFCCRSVQSMCGRMHPRVGNPCPTGSLVAQRENTSHQHLPLNHLHSVKKELFWTEHVIWSVCHQHKFQIHQIFWRYFYRHSNFDYHESSSVTL